VNLQNTLVAAAGVTGVIASIFSIAYGFVLNASQAETMMTWSCKWGDLLKGARPNFQRVCTESVSLTLVFRLNPSLCTALIRIECSGSPCI
jgi:hypothetical protein